jgi:acyl carrier protein
MENVELKKELTDVFLELFELDELELTDEMTANDIDKWDSMTHLLLITKIEEQFSIEVTGMDIMHLNNVGNLIELIKRKKAI